MADTAAQLLEVVRRLRAQGHTVVEVPGWQTRGTRPMTARGRLEHHTAGARTGDTPSLHVVTFGRAGLRNALCRWYVSRSGVIYLVALRLAWHAGAGVKGSNATLSGTEAEHSGSASEPWTAASLAAQAAVSATEADVLGYPRSAVWEHREHAPSRKIDRTGIDGARWRARVVDTATGPTSRPSPTPTPTPTPAPTEDDEMTPAQDRILRQTAVDARIARADASKAKAALGRIETQLGGRNVAEDLRRGRLDKRSLGRAAGLKVDTNGVPGVDIIS